MSKWGKNTTKSPATSPIPGQFIEAATAALRLPNRDNSLHAVDFPKTDTVDFSLKIPPATGDSKKKG